MSSLQVFVLLVDDLFQVTRNMFSVQTSSDANVDALTAEVRDHMKPMFDHLKTNVIRVYRFSDKAPEFEFDDESTMRRLVSEAFSNDHVIFLRNNRKIARLKLSEEEVLLVKVPITLPTYDATTGEPVTATPDQKYEPIFLRATTRGNIIQADIQSNNIEDVTGGDFPQFLESFERKLGRKRMLLDERMRGVVETLFGATSNSYFELDQSMAGPSDSIPVVGRIEFSHIAHISSIEGVKLVKRLAKQDGDRRLFNEADANWLYFQLIAFYLESHPSDLTSDGNAKFAIKQWMTSRRQNPILNLS